MNLAGCDRRERDTEGVDAGTVTTLIDGSLETTGPWVTTAGNPETWREAGQIGAVGVLQDLGQRAPAGVAQHPEAVVQVAVQLHEADGGEAIEPGVSRSFHDLLKALLLGGDGDPGQGLRGDAVLAERTGEGAFGHRRHRQPAPARSRQQATASRKVTWY